jgi:DNA (cytosine-5)-methyltransferase 1
MRLRYQPTTIELCAGIAGFSSPLTRPLALVEKEPTCRAVLRRHHPHALILDDVRSAGADTLPAANIIKFGFPCQDLSVAGNRAGLAGARSGLYYECTRIVDELRPDFAVWENVPGLLSSDDGRDFARVLMELERIGYCGSWTTLDAQFFGVAQRRQRVFGVFARRDIGAAVCAEILSLTARLPWNTQARRTARQSVAPTLESGTNRTGGTRPPGTTVDTAETLIPVGYSTSGQGWWRDGIGPEAARSHKDAENGVVVSIAENQCGELRTSDIAAQLTVGGGKPGQGYPAVFAFEPRYYSGRDRMGGAPNEKASTLRTEDHRGDGSQHVSGSFGVRRLTPVECERLQGFADDYTAWGMDERAGRVEMSDSTRYRMLGNAVCKRVSAWIDQRIVEVFYA